MTDANIERIVILCKDLSVNQSTELEQAWVEVYKSLLDQVAENTLVHDILPELNEMMGMKSQMKYRKAAAVLICTIA